VDECRCVKVSKEAVVEVERGRVLLDAMLLEARRLEEVHVVEDVEDVQDVS
jgi:hypothetical protein